ncbi:MAG: CoA transferase [Actinomycetota bacterium]
MRHITGDPDRPPARANIGLTDCITGLYAAFGTMMALRHRDLTGRGQVVDTALYECAFSFMDAHVAAYEKLGYVVGREGAGTGRTDQGEALEGDAGLRCGERAQCAVEVDRGRPLPRRGDRGGEGEDDRRGPGSGRARDHDHRPAPQPAPGNEVTERAGDLDESLVRAADRAGPSGRGRERGLRYVVPPGQDRGGQDRGGQDPGGVWRHPPCIPNVCSIPPARTLAARGDRPGRPAAPRLSRRRARAGGPAPPRSPAARRGPSRRRPRSSRRGSRSRR